MSPYSMPLCTIFTKWPAPSGPTCVTHGPASVFAAMASSTSRMIGHASFEPPGISDGPNRAPSSPPDTPQPTKWMPGRPQRRLAAPRVLEPRVAAVDDDVAAVEQRQELLDRRVDGLARGNHHHDPARPLERRRELLEGRRALRTSAPGCSSRKSVDPLGFEVPDRDAIPARLDVERKVAPHGARGR